MFVAAANYFRSDEVTRLRTAHRDACPMLDASVARTADRRSDEFTVSLTALHSWASITHPVPLVIRMWQKRLS